MKYGRVYLFGILGILACACHQPQGKMAAFILPGAKNIKLADGEAQIVTYTIRLAPPAEKQFHSLADERKWRPLKIDFAKTSSTLLVPSVLFEWQPAYGPKSEEQQYWMGQWQNPKGEVLIVAAIYDPAKTSHGKVDMKVRAIILSPSQAKKFQEFINKPDEQEIGNHQNIILTPDAKNQ